MTERSGYNNVAPIVLVLKLGIKLSLKVIIILNLALSLNLTVTVMYRGWQLMEKVCAKVTIMAIHGTNLV